MVAVGSATEGAIAASGGGGRQTSGTAYLAATPRTTKGLVYYAGFNSDKVLGPGAATYTIKPTTATSGTITATAKKVTLWTRHRDAERNRNRRAPYHQPAQDRRRHRHRREDQTDPWHGRAGRPFNRGHVLRLGEHSHRPVRVPLQGHVQVAGQRMTAEASGASAVAGRPESKKREGGYPLGNERTRFVIGRGPPQAGSSAAGNDGESVRYGLTRPPEFRGGFAAPRAPGSRARCGSAARALRYRRGRDPGSCVGIRWTASGGSPGGYDLQAVFDDAASGAVAGSRGVLMSG